MKRKTISEIIIIAVLFIWAEWWLKEGSDLKPELQGAAAGVALALLVEWLFFLYQQRKFIALYAKCLISERDLRLSIAYIFKIEVKGKYLLVVELATVESGETGG